MPKRSIIDQLPAEARGWLKAKLKETNFSRYVELTDEFNEWAELHGLEVKVSKTSLHRFGQRWEEKLELFRETTEFAQAALGDNPDDEGATNELAIRMFQQQVFKLAMEEDLNPKTLATLSRAVADLARASVAQKRWAAAYRERADKKLAQLEAESRKGGGGLDPETLRRVREDLYGIV